MVKQNKGSDEDKEAKVISNDNLNMVGLLKSIKPGEKIVISGISGSFPNAQNIQEFRDNLFNKVHMPIENRWKSFKHPELPLRTGLIPGADKYDAGYFGVHERQSKTMDGTASILQEKTIEAILDAGLHPADLENTRTGVYIGTCASETEVVMCKSTTNPQEYVMTGCPRSMQAHRLSYFLKLKGPSFVTDTACSSSLYAFEHAFRALMLGEIDNAIVGGTNLCLHPFDSLQFARLGVLSMSGTCNVFDEKGDGYVRSEAIGVVLLQKYKNAKRMYSEVIYAKSNCDGYKEQGITYPSREVQTNLLKEFYEECNIDPNSLSYLEAHGTGTTVGDPEECSAIDAVLTNNRKRPLLVGSVKSNIGHTEPASGVCSIIKSIIGMETGFIPPNINFTVPRDKIRGIIEGRMKVVTDKMPFEDNRGLVAVNSFGFGGGNCHILIRWNPKEKINGGLPKDPLPRLVCVSGRTEDSITSLLDDFSNNKLDAEHVALIHNIFRKNIQNHTYRGYIILSIPGEISRSIVHFNGKDKPLYFMFGELKNWCDIGNNLMVLPVFAKSIQRTQTYLLDKGVDISNILIKKTPHSNTYQILGSVMVQIGIIDTLQLLEIKPIECIGYSFGVLSAAYYDGSITLEETINCALVIKEFINVDVLYEPKDESNNQENAVNCNHIENGGDILNGTDSKWDLRKNLKENSTNIAASLKEDLAKVMGTQKLCFGKTLSNKNRSAEYLINSLMSNFLQESKNIKLNSLIINISSNPTQKDVEDITVISPVTSGTKNYLVGLLETFGRLYEYGYNPKLEKLYPTVDLPVSRGTRMISPYIKWRHNREKYIPEFYMESNSADSGSAVYKIQQTDHDWAFVSGHVIDGRNLFPATGYLYLAWHFLSELYSVSMDVLNVAFENCKFIRATTLSKNMYLQFTVVIQMGTGYFKISEGDSIVVTGRIYKLDDKPEDTVSYNPIELSNALSLKTKDVYKELRLRGYNYKGEFRAIQECDSSATIGYINWNKNWITFMDNMLQMKILQSDTRLLYVPTYIAKLTISSQKHLEWIHNKYTNEGKSTDLPVFNDQSTGIISCGGINIWGLTASSIARRKYLGSPVLESYKFVPNITSLTTEQSIRVTMQVILENTLAYKIKVVELIDDYSAKGGKYLTPVILSVLEDQPLIQPCVKILSKTPLDVTIEVEDKELSSESDCSLVIGTSILGRSETLKDASLTLKEKGFILSRESLNFDMSTTNHLAIEVITVHKTETDYLILFQNCPSLKKYIRFPISSSNNFSWVPALKDIIEKKVNDDIVIYSENEPNSGILGLINCLRREPNGQNIRCVFVMDKDKKFQPDNSNYTAQLKKCMAINVFKNGQWGTYRHLLLHECDDVESEHCFANVTVRGDLSSLRWVQGPLQHDQVITPENKLTYIYYAALNFRDIMTALGKIDVDIISQDRKEQECVQGLEFSGRDERGNRLMGIVNAGALSTLVLVDSNLTFKVPDAWSLEEAATVPVVYLTVLYALHTRGDLKHGETILIHSGTGGIGLAAIQLALHHGCTVFTTVGTRTKRDFLMKTYPQLKAHHIGNSRDESFEEMIFKGTKGRGVDMVLNSLAEDKLLASVRCLARGGRFIEIGKFDLANNNQLNLLLFKKNVSFQGVMLDMLFKESPRNKLILSQLMAEGIRSGAIKPLKRTIFKFNEVEQAFRFMASGKHMGKVLIQIRESENQLDSLPSIQKFHCIPRYLCNPDMLYMIIGGLGGFGLELADWLVLRGAKKLVLTSRSGISTGYQNYRIRLWQSYGTIVKISKSDITSRSGCQELIEESQELGPIDAVFNLAVVLNDSIFENQTPDSFNTAFAPKALATQYLDELTRKLCPSLRHFVIFSSVSCGRGNPGQTNYGMANSVMERICENRKRDGFPALTVQWGAVGEVGLVAEMKEESTELAIGGTLQQPISSCLRVLDGFLTQNDEVIVSSMVVAEKQGLGVADNIVDAVINVLGVTNIKTISIHSTMAELGMDSMTAVEIKQILERDFEVILNATEMRTMTLARLKEIQTEKIVNVQGTESNNLNAFGLETILRLIGNESESRLLHKRLDSKVDAKAVAPKLLLFPGIEGFFKVFEPLAVHLNAHTISVQYSYYNLNATVEYTAKSLLPIVVEYITKNQPFTILAYSYGVLIALEVVNLLESKGYTGTILCLDGSPLFLKKILNTLNTESDPILQTEILYTCISLFVKADSISGYKEKLLLCNSWEDRLDLFVKITKDVSNITESYKRTLASGLYQRIKALKDYNPSYNKLKSKAKLYKARYESIQGLPEDYGLSQLIENPVEVKTFEGNHASVLTNELLIETINAFISEEQ